MNQKRLERQIERSKHAMQRRVATPRAVAIVSPAPPDDPLPPTWRNQMTPEGEKVIWSKWSDDRTDLAYKAAKVWLPLDDLRDFLNRLPGERLTEMDVHQRLQAIREDQGKPDEALREECFLHYAVEKAKGTEFIANLNALCDWLGATTTQRWKQQWDEQARQRALHDDKMLRSGQNWPRNYGAWARVIGLPGEYCRKAGRLFRFDFGFGGGIVTEIDALDDIEGTIIGQFETSYRAAQHVHAICRDNNAPQPTPTKRR